MRQPPRTPAKTIQFRAEALALIGEGWSLNGAARVVGLPESTLRNWIKRGCRPAARRTRTRQPPEHVRKVLKTKGTASEVAAKLGLTRNAVIGIWNRHRSHPRGVA